MGWNDAKPPADPVGARYGRNDDGTSNGRAYEKAAVMGAIMKVLTAANPHPIASGARWFNLMSSNGITATSEHTYTSDIAAGCEGMMNYTRAKLDEILHTYTPQGWQFAFHVNGDIGLDIVLDAYERALSTHGLLGTDHRWRTEHCGAGRGDQFDRAARLGIAISLSPFQFIYWGDVLDGTLFPPDIGAQWMRPGDAFRSGAMVSFHNDGMVSPLIPLLNVQAMVTRVTPSG